MATFTATPKKFDGCSLERSFNFLGFAENMIDMLGKVLPDHCTHTSANHKQNRHKASLNLGFTFTEQIKQLYIHAELPHCEPGASIRCMKPSELPFDLMSLSVSQACLDFQRRPFTIEEDAKLIEVVNSIDPARGWDVIASHMEGRTARQCRERWIGYLCPSIRVAPWTDAEDEFLLSEIQRFGHKWTLIAQHFNGRSGNDVKNRWYSHLKAISVFGPDGPIRISRDLHRGSAVQNKRKKRKTDRVSTTVSFTAETPRAKLMFAQPQSLLLSSLDWELAPLLPPRRRTGHD